MSERNTPPTCHARPALIQLSGVSVAYYPDIIAIASNGFEQLLYIIYAYTSTDVYAHLYLGLMLHTQEASEAIWICVYPLITSKHQKNKKGHLTKNAFNQNKCKNCIFPWFCFYFAWIPERSPLLHVHPQFFKRGCFTPRMLHPRKVHTPAFSHPGLFTPPDVSPPMADFSPPLHYNIFTP